MVLSMRNPKRKTEQERCYKGIQLVHEIRERGSRETIKKWEFNYIS